MEFVVELYYSRSKERREAEEADAYLEFFRMIRPQWGVVVTVHRSEAEEGGVIIATGSFEAEGLPQAWDMVDRLVSMQSPCPLGARIVKEPWREQVDGTRA